MYKAFAIVMLLADALWVQPGAKPTASRLIIVFARSQTEMPRDVADTRQRLREVTARKGRDRLPLVIRQADDTTPGEIGMYVVNREGGPIVADLVLRAR